MLDNGTKKRIDSARDILKFMDDMDNETEELGDKAAPPKNPYASIDGEKIAKENQWLLLDDINL